MRALDVRLETAFRVFSAGLLALILPACGAGPTPVADWRMADRTRDEFTDNPPADPRPGPDGVVDVYDHAQGPLLPRRNGNISTKFPADGLYDVILDACGTEGAARFSWSIDGGPSRPADDCATTVRLPEGEHTAQLTVADAGGAESGLRLSVNVQDLIVVGLGDSFSAGSENSRGGLVSADYDNIECTRSGRSGQAARRSRWSATPRRR